MSETEKQPVQPAVATPTPPTTVVQKTVKVQETPKPQPVPAFEEQIEALKKTGDVNVRAVIAAMEGYITTMQPGVIVPDEKGARTQYSLWKTISNVAENTTGQQFKQLWSLLLAYYDNNRKGVFHEYYCYRFSHAWAWSIDELSAFQKVLRLFQLTADPAMTETGLKQQNFDQLFAVGFSETARANILAYYNR